MKRKIPMGLTWLELGITLMLASSVAFAQQGTKKLAPEAGNESGHRGDYCEQRIQDIRNDLQDWIKAGGSAFLDLPASISLIDYNEKMFDHFKSARISCVSKAVEVENVQKTCKNFIDPDGSAHIVCDMDRFLDFTPESEQYMLIHHEFAGLADFEAGSGSTSDYRISRQIPLFLGDKTIKKMTVAPIVRRSCHERVCVGDTVLYGDSIRQVELVGDGGRVVLKENSWSYRSYTDVDHVTLAVPQFDGYASGDIVLFGDSIRTVELVDDTGRVVLKENSWSYRSYTDDRQISKTLQCFDKVCVGDTVLFGDSIRTIELVDDTGRVVLKENSWNYRTYTDQRHVTVTRHCIRSH